MNVKNYPEFLEQACTYIYIYIYISQFSLSYYIFPPFRIATSVANIGNLRGQKQTLPRTFTKDNVNR
jgi:hypothetical protein